MYSLGIILFELYNPFSTEMEKVINIQNLKETFKFTKEITEKYPQQVFRIKKKLVVKV